MNNRVQFLVDFGERLFVLLIALPFVVAFIVELPSHPYFWGLLVSELMTVGFILIRKPGMIAMRPYPLAIALAGTALPLFVRPGGALLIPTIAVQAIMIGGLAVSISSKAFLNRSFGLIAANRGIKRSGPYRFVRHPMYLGYILTQFGFLLGSFSLETLALYLLAWTFQILRIIEEERLLLQDENYQNYAKEVPRRLVPGF